MVVAVVVESLLSLLIRWDSFFSAPEAACTNLYPGYMAVKSNMTNQLVLFRGLKILKIFELLSFSCNADMQM